MLTLKDNLLSILNDLEVSKTFSRESLYEECIRTKLKNTTTTYSNEVDMTTEYLLKRASEKVLKSLSRIQKESDKEALNKYLNKD